MNHSNQSPLMRMAWAILIGMMIAVSIAYGLSLNQPKLPILRSLTDFSLTNQWGANVQLSGVKGQVGVYNTIFSRCPTQCYRLSQQMSRIQKNLPSGAKLYSLTADPEFDTPSVLEKYGRRHDLDTNKWQFLTGTKREIYRVATQDLLFSLMENPEPANAKLEDLFIHSTDFAIVDRHGRLRVVVHGEEPDAEKQILSRVAQLLRER